MKTEPTCEERIAGYLESTAKDITEMMGERLDNRLDPHYGYVDVVDTEAWGWEGPDYVRYQMSGGGPSDELRFYRDGKIEYWFLDWFDGASRIVTDYNWAQWLKWELVNRNKAVFQFIHFGRV